MVIPTLFLASSMFQAGSISFGNRDAGDLMLFVRFAEMTMKKPPILVVGSGSIGVFFTCDEATKDKMLDRFSQQYGVDIRKSDSGKPIEPFTRFTIAAEDRPGLRPFSDSFSSSTLLGRGIHDILGAFTPFSDGWTVESLTYFYRPYIDDGLNRRDAVWLDFHFLNPSGAVVNSENLYVDGASSQSKRGETNGGKE